MSKDILVVRMCKLWNDLSNEDRSIVANQFDVKFKDLYNVMVMFGENETIKTTFEIIRYEKNI